MQEVGAAVAAAQILAFSKEPLRHRPRLTHGRETFPGGLQVFRFAQGRFPPGVFRELSAAERERLRQAAAFFIRQVCLWEGATHYQVLCISPEASRESIKEHYHGLMALIHPDRQDAGSDHWPSQSAQRVNQAYAVLSDESLRRAYDAGLRKSAARPAIVEDSVEQPHQIVTISANLREKILPSRWRFRRQFLPVAAVLSALFFVHIWWAAESAESLSSLGSDASFEQHYQWARDVFSGGGLPRFLGTSKRQPLAGEANARAEPESFLGRVARAFSGAEPRVPAARAPEIAAVTPAEPPPAEPDKKAVPAVRLDPAEMELLVIRLVASYEAGDFDRLLSLFDADDVGLWESLRLRYDYQEFFRSTRSRRLRIKWISWESDSRAARAKGQLMLVAEYHEQGTQVERLLPLEMTVTARHGQLRIARLSLFPHE